MSAKASRPAWAGSRFRLRKADAPRGRHTLSHVFAAALALTLLNAAKPVTMDDPSYLLHARQIASHPMDPYGGEMFLYQTYGPAIRNNAPPVCVYWLGLGLRLLGDHPFLWKLWLFPWALLLGAALRAMLVRFAPGVETPVVWMTLLSSAVLPAFNFMLDIPALAMILAAVALFARAAERDEFGTAALAGLVAGLAMETKYTGVMAPAAILAYGLVARRPRLAIVACGVAAALFVGWEALMHARYGDSQFLSYLGRRARGASGVPRARLVVPLFRIAGTLAAGLVPLAMIGLGAPRRAVVLAASGIAAAVAAYALLPDGLVAVLNEITGGRVVNFENVTLGLVALLSLVVVGLVVRRLARGLDRLDRFLLLWLVIEILGYFTVSTAPGARRVFGVLTVLTLLTARAVSRNVGHSAPRTGLLRGAAAFGVALGLAFWAVDFDDALAQRDDVQLALERTRAEVAGAVSEPATVWYIGNHFGGFQFYAPRAGLRPALTGRSTLHAGDWLVIPLFVQEKYVRLDRGRLLPAATLTPVFRLPLTTRYAYNGGGTPLRRPARDWVAAGIYRVTGNGIIVLKDLRPS